MCINCDDADMMQPFIETLFQLGFRDAYTLHQILFGDKYNLENIKYPTWWDQDRLDEYDIKNAKE